MVRDFQAYAAKKIDRDALDEELCRQPMLFLSAAEALVSALSSRDQAKEDLDLAKAEAYLEVRRRLEQEGSKATEALIAAEVERNRKYRSAVDKYLVSREEAAKLEAIKETFQQRGYILKTLADLLIAGHYTTSSVRGESSRQVQEEAYDRSRDRIAKQRRRIK